MCEIILPRLQKRSVLEENGQLKPRWSALEEDLEAIVAEEEANKIVSSYTFVNSKCKADMYRLTENKF